jgi:threonine-phosphate decarboxylase
MVNIEKGLVSITSHGGNVESIAAHYQIPVDELIDFSANINPLGPPFSVLKQLAKDASDIQLLMRYPDIELTKLRVCLSTHTGINPSLIIIGNGTAALIGPILRAINAKRCAIPIPAFNEYDHALVANGCQINRFPLCSSSFLLDTSRFISFIEHQNPTLCILNNPHNPSGALLSKIELVQIIDRANQLGIYVLVDEAFIDYVPGESITSYITQYDNLIVLRSLTKFYGMPALRIGYAVAPTKISSLIQKQLPSWPITTLAANAAIEALKDSEYSTRTLEVNGREKEYLKTGIENLGLRVLPSVANFLLIELPYQTLRVSDLRAQLITRHRIIIRDCSDYEGLETERYMRVSVRYRNENNRLIEALRSALLKYSGL